MVLKHVPIGTYVLFLYLYTTSTIGLAPKHVKQYLGKKSVKNNKFLFSQT